MNRSLLSLVFVLSLLTLGNAQELPDFTPPSPTPFELTKYGNIPINESSGKINASIPIYEFDAGNLKVPIELSYSGAGVKVDQLSSWTGINWNLNAGGVITRIVKDLPDEISVGTTNRVLLNADDLNSMDLTLDSDDTYYLNQLASLAYFDTKVDEFNFSFLNYSGSFYLDELYQPKLANYDKEMKIEFDGGVQNIDDQTIIITTSDGVKYYFGGVECEKTRIRNTADPVTSYYTTSYYLYNIIHPFGDLVTFEYGNEPNESFEIKFSEHQEYSLIVSSNNDNCESSVPTGYSSFNSFNRIYHGKYLKKIHSNRSSVYINFNSEALNTYPHFKRRLTKIDIINSSDSSNDKSITLNYIMDDTRFFLNKAIFSNQDNSEKFKYELFYDSPLDLPDRFSYAKDHLGYYNGQLTNQTLLPANSHYKFINGISGFNNLANRDPNINFAKKGSLEKIIYPTKGFTTFEYEGAPVKVDSYANVFLTAYSNLSEMYPNAHPNPDTALTDHLNLQSIDDLFDGLYKTQNIIVNISALAQGNINHHYKIKFNIKDLVSNTNFYSATYSLAPDVFQYSWSLPVTLEKGKYYQVNLELEADPNSQSTTSPVDVKVNFRYINGYDIEEGLGVRVKKVTDYSENNVIADSKRYYYGKIEDVISNINYMEDYNYDSLYLSWNKIISCCVRYTNNIPLLSIFDWFDLIKLSSETANSIFPSSDGPVYDVVTISYGGDNFEGGALEKTFKSKNGIYPLSYFNSEEEYVVPKQFETDKSNHDIFNGKVISEKFFSKKNNDLFLSKVNNYNYSITFPNSVSNIQINRVYSVCTVEESNFNSLTGLYIGFYETSVNKIALGNIENIEYVEPVPLSDLSNADNYKHISTGTIFEYNSYVGQPTKTTKTTSESDRFNITKYYYVDQLNQLSGLNIDQIDAYNTLKSMFVLSNPIQTETYQLSGNNILKLLSTQRTLYKNWNSGALVLPEIIQTAKGADNLENRILFHDYNNHGDVLEVSKNEGTHIRYEYNARSLVVKKLENHSVPEGTNGDFISTSNCDYVNLYPDKFITTYKYKNGTRLLESIKTPNCQMIYYEYDYFDRLKRIKDNDGNILSENDYHYKN